MGLKRISLKKVLVMAFTICSMTICLTLYKSASFYNKNIWPSEKDRTFPPLADYNKYPCIPGIPYFPTGLNWALTGKCVRMFNDTEREKQLNSICVPLNYLNQRTLICIYEAKHDHLVSGSLLYRGEWEGGMVNTLAHFLNNHPDVEFLDLGCNIGSYTIPIAHLGRKVVAVDAVIDNLALLSKSLKLTELKDRVTLIWNAISNGYSKVTLTKEMGNIGATGIRELTIEDETNKTTYITHTIKLDDLIPLFKGKRIVIKMDIEKQEHNALLGARAFFDAVDVLWLQMEIMWHKKELSGPIIVDFLSSRGFQPFANFDIKQPLSVSNIADWPWDVYFIKLRPVADGY